MTSSFRVSADAIWTETDSGDIFAGRAPHGPVLHLAGAGGAIFLAVAEEEAPVTTESLIETFLPVAGLPRDDLAAQISSFVADLLEQGLLTGA